jgi:hypothetical protein
MINMKSKREAPPTSGFTILILVAFMYGVLTHQPLFTRNNVYIPQHIGKVKGWGENMDLKLFKY